MNSEDELRVIAATIGCGVPDSMVREMGEMLDRARARVHVALFAVEDKVEIDIIMVGWIFEWKGQKYGESIDARDPRMHGPDSKKLLKPGVFHSLIADLDLISSKVIEEQSTDAHAIERSPIPQL